MKRKKTRYCANCCTIDEADSCLHCNGKMKDITIVLQSGGIK